MKIRQPKDVKTNNFLKIEAKFTNLQLEKQ